MKKSLCLFLSVSLLTSCDQNGENSNTSLIPDLNNKAKVASLKVGEVYDFPVVETYDPDKSKKINGYLINSILGEEFNAENIRLKLEEQAANLKNSYSGLTSLSHTVAFNNDDILSINVHTCWVGNRENCEESQYNFDLKTGYSFGLDQILIPSKKSEIKTIIVDELERRLNQSKMDMIANEAWTREFEQNLKDELYTVRVQFEPSNFKLSDKGLTFVYHSFPFDMGHMAYFPSPDYFYSWDQLRPYLLKDSPVSALIR